MSRDCVEKIQMLDMDAQHREIGAAIEQAAIKVLRSGRHILGPETVALEKSLAYLCKVPHAVGVSSGSDALLMALMALDIGAGDEVITTTYSFFATGGAIARTGATPRFADILPETFNLDPDSVQAAITPATKAIILVHLFGQCASMNRFQAIAKTHGVALVEDAAQSIGSSFEITPGDPEPAGSMGDIGCFSFFPSKNLGCAGDGGLVTTGSQRLHEKLKRLRNHGAYPRYHHTMIGGNFRLDEIQAAILSAKLTRLETWTEARQANAGLLKEGLRPQQDRGLLELPGKDPQSEHVYNQFTVVLNIDRTKVTEILDSAGIGWAVYYPLCLHLQQCFGYLGGRKGDCPVAERISNKALSLPIHPWLTREHVDRIIETFNRF